MSRRNGVEDPLDQLTFFKGMREEHLVQLYSLARETRFEPDQIIFREGDESRKLYIIRAGRVALEVTALGRTLRVLTIGEGEEFGWSSILPSVEKQMQARALTKVYAMVFDGAQLRAACDAQPDFGYEVAIRLLNVVSERLYALRVQLLDLYSPGGKQ
jgi:CRP-like cAMP-binding protein